MLKVRSAVVPVGMFGFLFSSLVFLSGCEGSGGGGGNPTPATIAAQEADNKKSQDARAAYEKEQKAAKK